MEQESVNIHEAKTHLSRLVERAAAGEEIVISKAGKPMARLVPLGAPAVPRSRGIWQLVEVVIHDDFDELPDGLVTAFSGEIRRCGSCSTPMRCCGGWLTSPRFPFKPVEAIADEADV